jgi:hypothetical protein
MTAMSVAGTAEYAESFNNEALKKYESMESDGKSDSEETIAAKEEVAKNLYGEDATISGNKITYKDENGEEQTKELTDEEFKE